MVTTLQSEEDVQNAMDYYLQSVSREGKAQRMMAESKERKLVLESKKNENALAIWFSYSCKLGIAVALLSMVITLIVNHRTSSVDYDEPRDVLFDRIEKLAREAQFNGVVTELASAINSVDENQLPHAEQRVSEVRSQLSRSQEGAEMGRRVLDRWKRMQSLSEMLQRGISEQDGLYAQAEQAIGALRASFARYRHASDQIERHRTSIRASVVKIQQLLEDSASLQQRQHDAEEQISKAKDAVKQMRSHLDIEKSVASDAQRALLESSHHAAEVRHRLQAHQKQYAAAIAAVEDHDRNVQSATARIPIIKQELEELLARKEDTRSELDRVQMRLSDFERQSSTILFLRNEFEDLLASGEPLGALSDAISREQEAIEQLRKQIVQVSVDSASTQQEPETTGISKASYLRHQLRLQQVHSERRLESFRFVLEELKLESMDDRNAVLAIIDAQARSTQSSLDSLSDDVTNLERVLKALEVEIRQRQSNEAAFNELVHQARQSREKLQDVASQMKSQLDEAQNEIVTAEQLVQQCTEAKEIAEANVQKAQDRVRQKYQASAEADEVLSSVRKEIALVQEAVISELHDKKTALQHFVAADDSFKAIKTEFEQTNESIARVMELLALSDQVVLDTSSQMLRSISDQPDKARASAIKPFFN